ncbi:MAG: ABC transporter permease [Clostridia bacterium]|nr:ABC transporter permease [Clostridia bacterium]
MKQFSKILKFELKNYLQNKIFVGITVFLVAVIAIVMFFPRLAGAFASDNADAAPDDSEKPVIAVLTSDKDMEGLLQNTFSSVFSDHTVTVLEQSELESVKEKIQNGEMQCAFALKDLTSYTYYVNNLSLYDSNAAIAAEALQTVYRMNAMINQGLTLEEAQAVLTTPINYETESLGKNQIENFFYTYIMIFALYMVILLYGQMVATNVATEKSSRAMELLVTSANPVSMMFGKVISSCLAGLFQLVAVFGSALLFFHVNASYWSGNVIIESIFNMPIELFIYMLLFFVLGFLVYAFLYGAIGSTASKLEDINTSVMPVTVLFIIGFFIVVFSMTEGNVDNSLMKIASFVTFTSPMAMFTRIAMTTVPLYEILISILILIASVFGVGFLSAKIYRVGVLLYGTPPKIGAIIKAIRKK